MRVRLRLAFPNEEYADEYGACRQYLPETLSLDQCGARRARRRHASPAS